MSNLPTYSEHVRQDAFEKGDDQHLPYYVRLVKAMGYPINKGSVYVDLAWVGYNYVKAQSRLNVIAGPVSVATKQEIDAQSADVTAWQNRANNILETKSAMGTGFYNQVVAFMSQEAFDSQDPQRLDDDEVRHMELGFARRIGEVVVEPEVHVYQYDAY